jgi:hypothetical protein
MRINTIIANLEANLRISGAQIDSVFMVCYHGSMLTCIREGKFLVTKSLVIHGFGGIKEIAVRLG